MSKKMLIRLLIMVFICSCIILIKLDYQHVNLVYIGQIKITPPLDEFIGNKIAYFVRGGDTLKNYLNKGLFSLTKKSEYIIKWDKTIIVDNDAIYYVCLGCQIKKINYFYHTKFFNFLNSPTLFEAHSVLLEPLKNKNIIMIYKSDVIVIGI
jgi:hypothetical protein